MFTRFNSNVNEFIIFELSQELLKHKQQLKLPVVDRDENVYGQLYVHFKNKGVADLLIERYTYGFNLEWDVNRLSGKSHPIDVDIHTKEDCTCEIKIENIKVDMTDVQCNEKLCKYVDPKRIYAYALTTGKKIIDFADLPKLTSFQIS